VQGFHSAFLVGAGLSLLGFVATITMIRPAVGSDLDAELEVMERELGTPEAATE
jgi:hypothetical protein